MYTMCEAIDCVRIEMAAANVACLAAAAAARYADGGEGVDEEPAASERLRDDPTEGCEGATASADIDVAAAAAAVPATSHAAAAAPRND